MSDLIPWMAPWSGRALTLGVVVFGVTLALLALFGDRARGRRRCPRCAYDMRGAPSLTCPECGQDARRPQRLLATRRHWRAAVVALLLAASLPAYVVYRRVSAFGWGYYLLLDPLYSWFPLREEEVVHSGRWRVVLYRDRRDPYGERPVRVWLDGRAVFRDDSTHWSVDPAGFRDLNGDGREELVLQTWTGGNSYCYETHVLTENGTMPLRAVAVISEPEMVGPGADEFCQVRVSDPTFSEGRTRFAGSPRPSVVLSLLPEAGYEVAPERMRAPAWDAQRLRREAAAYADRFRKHGSDDAHAGIWSTMLDLIYSGNEPQAWQFLDLAWPEYQPGKARFVEECHAQLERSPYARELRRAYGAHGATRTSPAE